MDAIPVNVRRVQSPLADLEADVARCATLAKLMDSQFEIGTVKFGVDSLIGLVPVVGDALSFAIGLYPIYLARKHGLGRIVIGRMLMNLGVDFVVGAVPVVGDIADAFHKANLKNLTLLKNACEKRARD